MLLWPATQAFCCTISLFPPHPPPGASVVKSTRARCAGEGSLEAPGTADPKLNIDGGQQVGDLRFSATGRSGAARQNTAALWGHITSRLPRPRGASRCITPGGITTCSLAYSFCDGPSGGRVMPLLLADSISLTSLVNLDGQRGRLCHLSVIAWQCRWADGDDDEGIRGHSEVTTPDSKLFPDASRSCGATTKAA